MRDLDFSTKKERFEALFKSYYPVARGFIRKILGSTEAAEDLSQDIFLKLWSHMEILENIASPDMYIYRMARNASLNYLKHRSIRQAYARDIRTTNHADLYEIILGQETQSLIESAILEMPPQRRRIFLMSRKEGLTYVQIAKDLKISPKTVEVHMALALSQLKSKVK